MAVGDNPNLQDVLGAVADALVAELGADACSISRVIGDVLIQVAECVQPGVTLLQGQGYLVPDYPETARVLETREPRGFTLDDVEVDAAEADVLRLLGFGTLLMLPLDLNGTAWGLIEVYRRERRAFSTADISRAVELSRIT